MNDRRIVYFDYLRILAAFAVVVIHCSAGRWTDENVFSFSWQVFNFYDGSAQWAVPVFVMISGALFLGKEQSLKKLYTHSVLRIVVAFVFWSTLYAAWDYFVLHKITSIKEMLSSALVGHFHLWFLYMIIGLYIIVPFLNKIVAEKKTAWYFVILSFLFAFLVPQCIELIGYWSRSLSELMNRVVSKLMLHMVLGYSGYFVLGYLLHNTNITKKLETRIYIFGALGYIVTVAGSALLSMLQHAPVTLFFENVTVNILFLSVSIFVFAKSHLNKPVVSVRKQNLLSYLSKCSFGIYLIHPFFLSLLGKLNLTFSSLPPLLFVPIRAIILFTASLFVSGLLNKIPVVKKWIV